MKDNKKDKPQGILETVRKVNEKERRELEEKQAQLLKKEEKQREKYAKSLAEEKIELLKLKQGVIDESDKLDVKQSEKVHYTPWQKFKNFIYHNKWWLGIASFLTIMAAFLIYDTLTNIKADVLVMLLCDDTEFQNKKEDIAKYFDTLTEDYNDDGKKYADIIYIPISDDEDANMDGLYESNITRLSAEFQMGETMLVIADGSSDSLVVPNENLIDLEKLYPNDPNVKSYAYHLKNTAFAERIGFNGALPDDIYIGVRKVTKSLTSEKSMQKNYDIAIDVLDNLINDLSK